MGSGREPPAILQGQGSGVPCGWRLEPTTAWMAPLAWLGTAALRRYCSFLSAKALRAHLLGTVEQLPSSACRGRDLLSAWRGCPGLVTIIEGGPCFCFWKHRVAEMEMSGAPVTLALPWHSHVTLGSWQGTHWLDSRSSSSTRIWLSCIFQDVSPWKILALSSCFHV